jgi:hypothetical protein
MREHREPALPAAYRGKYACVLRVLDDTQTESRRNAQAYYQFLASAPQAGFIRAAGKHAFVLAHKQQLRICVGPFDGVDSPDLRPVLAQIRTLTYHGGQRFRRADVLPIPPLAKLILPTRRSG